MFFLFERVNKKIRKRNPQGMLEQEMFTKEVEEIKRKICGKEKSILLLK